MYWRLVKSGIDFEIALMRWWIRLQGPGHLRGLCSVSPNHLQLLCWPFINEDRRAHRVAEDLPALSLDFSRRSLLWRPLHFRFVLRYVCALAFQLCFPIKSLLLKGMGWFFSNAQGRDYKFLLVLYPIGVRGTLRVMHFPDLSFVLPIKLTGDRWRPASLSTDKELVSCHSACKVTVPIFGFPWRKGKVEKGFPNCQRLDPTALVSI